MRSAAGEDRTDAGRAAPRTHGEQVRAGVTRAALLDALLHEPRVISVFDALPSIASAAPADEPPDRADDLVATAFAAAQRTVAADIVSIDRMTALTMALGLTEFGPWLPAFLAGAADFRRSLETEDLSKCVLVDPALRAARAFVRSTRAEAERLASRSPAPVLRFWGGLLPATEPSEWVSRPPDWIELFTMLVEHASERLDWTSEATGVDRLWPYLLLSDFVWHVEPGDDPEVIHGLVGLWANGCYPLIDAHTRPRLPRGLVPDNSGLYPDGRPREGRRAKIRRWVGWYVDRDVRRIPLNAILRSALPTAVAPLERASEVRSHIGEVKRLLSLDLPLDAGQPLRLWTLAQANRSLLESLPLTGGESS